MANPQHRCVFVGNIPYDVTEEQLVQICEEVGPVVSFRLVIDRETGKPKGYGFCEYKDEETALSARRNLHGYDINGRQLRVDFAENDKNNDKSREQGRGGPGMPTNIASQNQTGGGVSAVHGDPSLHQAVGVQVAMAAAIVMAGTLGGGQTIGNTSQNGTQNQPILGTDPLTLHLAKIPKGQLIEVLTELKTMATQNKEQARKLFLSHPQLSKAVLQSHIMLKSVPPHMLQIPNAQQLAGPQTHLAVQGGQLAQPSSIQTLPGLPPLGQNKVQLGSLVPSQYASPSLPRFQTQPPAQHQGLQHLTLSGLPLAGNLQSSLSQQTGSLSNRVENQMATSSFMLQYPGQYASANLGHNPQLVAPIQPSVPTHKPTSSFGCGIPNNGNKDHDKPQHVSHNNPAQDPKVDYHPRLHESLSFVNDKGQIGHPPKLLKMEDGRAASFSPAADLNLSKAGVTDIQKQNHELAPGGVDSALLQQVLNLTPEQLKILPPEQLQQVIQLQQMLRQTT